MLDTLFAVAPVFLLIIAGYVLRRVEFVPEAFWPAAEKITYYLFFPSLLISNTAKAALGDLNIPPLVGVLVGSLLAMCALVVAARPWLRMDGPAFTCLFQAGIRPNVYVGMAVVMALFGEAGLTLIAVCIVISIPTVNFLCVVALARFAGSGGGGFRWADILLSVIKNPLLVSCVIGGLINASGMGLPPVLGPFMEILGRAALPLTLLAVGAGLDLAAARSQGGAVVLGSALRLMVFPVLTGLACLVFGVGGLTAIVCVIYAMLPTAPSAFVLAGQMGGNKELMAGIITATTLAAMVTMPAWILALV
jgi:malonate transporter and related proteins